MECGVCPSTKILCSSQSRHSHSKSLSTIRQIGWYLSSCFYASFWSDFNLIPLTVNRILQVDICSYLICNSSWSVSHHYNFSSSKARFSVESLTFLVCNSFLPTEFINSIFLVGCFTFAHDSFELVYWGTWHQCLCCGSIIEWRNLVTGKKLYR